ncbi:SDR family NAD(P)-dependent oxidoreductase [Nonomuraea sp. NEAU-A123]|uniref:SDR family NAD(P)-dependent oxidoreductase n=1 Tax=Nonomuraea sp. NEAU-A123 TaxID=2839649 RepID=UPI001BE3F4AC|nr:glucose 1-dehydrogenase [Nonomuraea sp. NEAU-A123]MBT2226731.1 SDR family oxidoreductase [Nonomuraea sp. NEAU-A123]
MKFLDQVVLVTGGGSGIGRATARAFAREGAVVVVAGRGAEPLAETVKLIEADGGVAAPVTADVTDEGDAARMVAEVVERYGRLDVAFNNAGMVSAGKVADLDREIWDGVLAVNLTGVWLSMKYEIAQMREQGGGVIINTSSNLGAHRRQPGLGAYVASKAAVSALTRTAALEYIGEGIRINAISPGPSDTPRSMRPGETEADRTERLKTTNPSGRVGTLDEIAAAVLYLASPEAGYAVGTDLVVDGGASA